MRPERRRKHLPGRGRKRKEEEHGSAATAHPVAISADRLSAVRRAIAVLQLAVIAFILLSCVLFGLAYVGSALDDTAYHIPAAVRIAQHVNPYWVDSPVDSHWFPAGAETAVAALVLLTGSLNVTNISGSLCFVGIVVLMYHFAGLWCRERLGRLATLACVSTIPLLIGQSLAFYVDIHLALVVCLSLYFQCRSLLRRNVHDAYYALTVALLAPSIKYSGLLMALVLVPACGFCMWKAAPPRRPKTTTIVLLLLAGLFAAGFYVRNWMYRGNPLYPFGVPEPLQPALAIMHTPYEVDPEHAIAGTRMRFPQPYVPRSWLKHEYTPQMTDDALGASAVVAAVCTLLSLLLVRRQPADRRLAWLFLLAVITALWATFPYGFTIPRYLLFIPILLALGPAVLYGAVRRPWIPLGLSAALLVFSGVYAVINVVLPTNVANGIRVASRYLVSYVPAGRGYAYARPGHLRIGYTSGFSNYIAALYDSRLTNTLLPLHYKNYPYNYWREMRSPEEFIRYVESLQLDYIHIFDERYPGVDLLRAHFPEKIMPIEMRGRR